MKVGADKQTIERKGEKVIEDQETEVNLLLSGETYMQRVPLPSLQRQHKQNNPES